MTRPDTARGEALTRGDGAGGMRYTRGGVEARCDCCGRWSLIDSGCASAGTGWCWGCTQAWERLIDERVALERKAEHAEA